MAPGPGAPPARVRREHLRAPEIHRVPLLRRAVEREVDERGLADERRARYRRPPAGTAHDSPLRSMHVERAGLGSSQAKCPLRDGRRHGWRPRFVALRAVVVGDIVHRPAVGRSPRLLQALVRRGSRRRRPLLDAQGSSVVRRASARHPVEESRCHVRAAVIRVVRIAAFACVVDHGDARRHAAARGEDLGLVTVGPHLGGTVGADTAVLHALDALAPAFEHEAARRVLAVRCLVARRVFR
jgi:hypothetical protein